MSSSATRAAALFVGLLLVGVVAYALFVASDPIGAFRNGGPFTGRVIDAETKKPIQGAFVLASWRGTAFIHGGGCVGHAIARTDSDGRFQIPWQGMRISWFLHDGIAPGGLNVWAVDRRPWDLGLDSPLEAGVRSSLPAGAPMAEKDIGTVALTPMHWEDYGVEESRRMSSCARQPWVEQTQEYLAYRSKWTRTCGAGAVTSGADFQALNDWMKRLPVKPPTDEDTSRKYGNQAVDPAAVSAANDRRTNFDRVDLLIHVAHEPSVLKSSDQLTDDDRRQACAALDVHVPGIQE